MTDQPLTEVIIDTHGPTITIKAAGTLDEVLTAALKAFHEARVHFPGPNKDTAGHVGFSGQLRDTPPAQPSSMYWAPGPYPIQNGGPIE